MTLDSEIVEAIARAIDNYAHFKFAANREAAAKAALAAATPLIEARLLGEMLEPTSMMLALTGYGVSMDLSLREPEEQAQYEREVNGADMAAQVKGRKVWRSIAQALARLKNLTIPGME